MTERILFNFVLALEGVFANKLRAILTALGIVFGVAAVIAMLAIGRGAQEAILEQMKLIGTNNIIIKTKDTNKGNETQLVNQKKKRPYSPGLGLADLEAISQILPTLSNASPEIIQSTTIIQSGKLERAKCIGVTNTFFELNNIKLGEGKFFHDKHVETGKTVCIIGKNIQTKFFSEKSPIGKKIKCGNTWLTIIGVLEKRIASKESLENLGIRDYNSDVYIPITTSLLRFKNRAYISKKDIKRGNDDDDEKGGNQEDSNYHQLDRLVLQIDKAENLTASAGIVSRLLERRHLGVSDFEIQIPEKQIEAQQKTQDTFNLVLAVIAGISLLVGGIGIMNIMLASVLERIKEIGVRRSLGAKQTDITFQFLFEAVFISLIGGILGVFLGVGAAKAIAQAADIPTIVSTWSIVLSFGVAATIGVVFGIVPAQQAAQLDPIKALRTD